MQPNDRPLNNRFDNMTNRSIDRMVGEVVRAELDAWEAEHKAEIEAEENRLLNEYDAARRAAMFEVRDRFAGMTDYLEALPFWVGSGAKAVESAVCQVDAQYFSFCRLQARVNVREALERGEAA